MRFRSLSVILALLAGVPCAVSGQQLLEAGQAFAASARPVDAETIAVRFRIAPGYYLYRDKLHFVLDPGAAAPAHVASPPGRVIEDPFFGRKETYRGRVEVRVTVPRERRGQRLTLIADSQGCADIGVCYPPFRQQLAVALPKEAR